jgi:hypothetical protein
MADTPINLNRVRKAKARAASEATAALNRVKFGRNKTEKKADKAGAAKATRDLDGHKRDH